MCLQSDGSAARVDQALVDLDRVQAGAGAVAVAHLAGIGGAFVLHVAALGLGLASNIPGRSPILDGFGLIAFASVFPIISVLGYAQLAQWVVRRRNRKT